MTTGVQARGTPSHFRSVATSLRWTLLGEVLFAGGQFGLLMVMARLGDDAALGQYALGLAIATPLFVLTSLHLRPTFVVQPSDDGLQFGHYVALRAIGAPLAVVLAALWAWVAGLDGTTTAVVACVALMRMSEMLADIFHAAAAREERLHRVGISRALRGVLSLGAVAVTLALTQSVPASLGVAALVGLALTFAYDLRTARAHADPTPRFDALSLRRLVVLAAPVGLAGGLLGLTTNTPAYVLEHSAGVEVLGNYAAVVSILFVSGVLNAAVGGAAVPRLARLFETSPAEFSRLLLRVAAVVAAAGAALFGACVVLGDVYLLIAYGQRFVHLQDALLITGAIAMVAGVANLLSQTLVAMKRFALQFGINVLTFCGAVATAFWLVPRHGMLGALLTLAVITALRLVIYVALIIAIVGGLARRGASA